MTLRQRELDGKIPFTWVGRERRFSSVDPAHPGSWLGPEGEPAQFEPGVDDGVDSSVTVLRVTHEDRLDRFGASWLKRLFAVYGVGLEVLHPKRPDGRDELLKDFVFLVTTFAGRLYGMRSAESRRQLLAESGQRSDQGQAA